MGKSRIDEYYDKTGTDVEQKRRQPDGKDAFDDGLTQLVDSRTEMNVAFFRPKMVENPEHARKLGEDGGDGSSSNTPSEERKMKIGARTMFTPTVNTAESMALCGYPVAGMTLLSPNMV